MFVMAEEAIMLRQVWRSCIARASLEEPIEPDSPLAAAPKSAYPRLLM